MRITSGIPVEAIEPGPNATANGLHAVTKPSVDSREAVAIALAGRPSLVGGIESRGIHIWYGMDARTRETLVAVSGSINGQSVRVVVNPATRTVVRAERLNATGGALLVSRDAGRTWDRSSISGVPLAIGTDLSGPADPPAVYAAIWSGESLGLWRSTDNGDSWLRLTVLPSSATQIAYDVAVAPVNGGQRVFIATFGGLWSFDIHTRRLSLEEAPGLVFALAADGDGQLHALALQPGQPETARHFVRGPSGLPIWALVSDQRADRLARGRSVNAFENESGESQTVDIALGAPPGRIQLKATGSAIERSLDGGLSWATVAPGHPARIAMSPNFDLDGIAIATAFPDVVLQTQDFGATWRAVAVLPGARHGGEPVFCSPALAFIITEGGLTWEDF